VPCPPVVSIMPKHCAAFRKGEVVKDRAPEFRNIKGPVKIGDEVRVPCVVDDPPPWIVVVLVVQ